MTDNISCGYWVCSLGQEDSMAITFYLLLLGPLTSIRYKKEQSMSTSSEWCNIRMWLTVAGFEDGGGRIQANEWRWPLESGKEKITDSPIKPPEGRMQYLDFSSERTNSDF
jgi:hypothetical protein